jgi:hypothetical protein
VVPISVASKLGSLNSILFATLLRRQASISRGWSHFTCSVASCGCLDLQNSNCYCLLLTGCLMSKSSSSLCQPIVFTQSCGVSYSRFHLHQPSIHPSTHSPIYPSTHLRIAVKVISTRPKSHQVDRTLLAALR